MRRATQASPEAIVLNIADTTTERVTPPCPHFGVCGGCQLQHIAYNAQTTAKQAMLLDVLRERGVSEIPTIQRHTADPWRYRNRIRMRIEGDAVGYSRRESNDFLAIETCPIASPLLERAALRLRDLVRAGKIVWPEASAALELFTDADEQSLQLSLHLDTTVAGVSRDAPGEFRTLCNALQNDIPQLIGAGLVAAAPDPQQSRRVQATQRVEIARWGLSGIVYRVAGHDYTITRNAFFQVNRYLTAEMVQTVIAEHAGLLAFDLFAGAGLFSVPLTERFSEVVAVEIGEPAATDLQAHLAAAGSSHRAVRSTTEAFLQRETRTPDLVVMDPPRAGVSLPALRALGRLRPRCIVYVSCDAGTFARDAKTLLESGYTLTALHLLDLFSADVPHGDHRHFPALTAPSEGDAGNADHVQRGEQGSAQHALPRDCVAPV